ncbi:GNAT family N-acetyltransferase [Sciscionella sediminilitoris]|uniref:GNAT family N-acetyltransferase n=1 Tax=Sciscionella sediminilitoris TaxID=1445613 RepID=UPI0004DF643F|nr:GNAT family N-acetyltransferase [Sciscionella sp. SE31]
MNETVIRPARDDELPTVAELRWRWLLEREGTPVTGHDEFVRLLTTWAREHAASHRCLVAVRENTIIGMAWLAIIARVPNPRSPERASGDMQCVYVVPAHRDSGTGAQLMSTVRALGRELGLERVTVHSSERAVPAYVRNGFTPDPRLLHAWIEEPH